MLDFTHSIRHKLIGMVLVTTLTALFVALIAIIAYDLRAYHRSVLANLGTQAELLGQTTASALAFDDVTVATENLALLRLQPRVQAAAVYTARGQRFATYVRPGVPLGAPDLPQVDGEVVSGRQVELFRRIVSGGEIVGTVYLRADYEFFDRLLDYLGIAVAVTLLAMLVAYLMSAWLQRIVTRPLLSVAGIAREVIDRNDFSRRAAKLSNDEVGVLVDSFNGMLTEIERRTGELQVTNTELERQVAERDRAEQEIVKLNSQLEDRVRDRTAQLEVANQELEAFAYSVSHDLRAPLRAIDGFSQALVDDFPTEAPEEARRYVTRIRLATARMGQLIEGLLNLSRVSRGAMERADVDLSEIARQFVAELQQREPERQVDVSIWDDVHAEGDPRLLRAVLENLIGNAWKFSARAERPRIEIGALRVRGNRTYFVRDNGAGFDMRFANNLFQPFQRLHATQEFSGTGIGLATVKRIVKRHGGKIWADAEVGKGAAFYFTLTPGEEIARTAPQRDAVVDTVMD